MSDPSTVYLQGLIDRMNAGDAAARDGLIEHACGRLERVARTIRRDLPRLRNAEETADVMQKAVVRLLRALKTATVQNVQDFFRFIR